MGRDQAASRDRAFWADFNPLSPHGERPTLSGCASASRIFQSTLPAWGETRERARPQGGGLHFNPLSPHGERLKAQIAELEKELISIHSPRMGRDPDGEVVYLYRQISIHSPRMGRDHQRLRLVVVHRHFNPLSPHGERRFGGWGLIRLSIFQSTLPAWGETSP